MPYITNTRRQPLTALGDLPDTPGELNYLLTKVLLSYLEQHGRTYTVLNDMVGALECAKLELYRRVVVPYEEQKLRENGDVYPATFTI